ncbi:MAG: tetratricopeptide repeat protein [Zetaproteobacteria bacterium]|nr:tetratricopeptide repeat protein [Zetaproteobacteria bacterium]
MRDQNMLDLVGLYTKSMVVKLSRVSEKMIANFQSVFSIDPSISREYYLDKGMQLAKKGEYAKAVTILEPLLREQGCDDQQVLLSLGVSMMHANRTEEGVKMIEHALQKDQSNLKIQAALGLAYTQVGQYENAIPLLNGVVESSPENYNAWYRLGVSHDHCKQYDEAIAAFEKALELRPDEQKLYSLIGYAYEQKGDRDQAVIYFKKASEQEAL